MNNKKSTSWGSVAKWYNELLEEGEDTFQEKIINTYLTYLEWPIDYSGHPKILAKNDFEKIRESEKLFARKFDMTIDSDILDMIDQMILSQS